MKILVKNNKERVKNQEAEMKKSTKIVKEESCHRAGIGDDRFQYDDRSGIVAGPCSRGIGQMGFQMQTS